MMTTRARRLLRALAPILFALSTCFTGVAEGQDRSAQVDRMNDKGKTLFKAGQKAQAASLWRQAFMLACGEDELDIANNLGIVYYQLGDHRQAHYFFAFSLAIDEKGGFKLQNRGKITAAVAQLEKTLSKGSARVRIDCSPVPNALVCIDEKDNCFKTPFAFLLPEGKHSVVVSRGKEEQRRVIEVQSGKDVTLTVEFPDIPAEETGYSVWTAGPRHGCGLTDKQTVECRGQNIFGQLGISSCDWGRPSATPVTGQAGPARQIAAGRVHTCALLTDGQIACWGLNNNGQLGDGTGGGSGDVRKAPALVVGLPGPARQVVAGRYHSCALLEDGTLHCWGSNQKGQLGTGFDGATLVMSAVPMPVAGLAAGVVKLTAGAYHTCALLKGGQAACWGDNQSGQLGDGTRVSRTRPTPTKKLAGTAVFLTAGDFHTCALLQEGTYTCWGANRAGQLGTGNTRDVNAPSRPEKLPGKARYLTAGTGHTCALLEGGKIACWGGNRRGQLGLQGKSLALAPIVLSQQATHVSAAGHRTCLLHKGRPNCLGR